MPACAEQTPGENVAIAAMLGALVAVPFYSRRALMNRLPSLTAADEPAKLASVTAAITSVFSPAWWPWSAVTVIVVVTIPAGHIRQTRSTARTFCTSIATAAQTGDTASVRLRSGRLLATDGTRHQARERRQLQDG